MGDPSVDVIIVGAGAAGLATAIFTARRHPGLHVALLDGAKRIGAKILVSGGGRCNVTNVEVRPDDFWGGSRHTIRRVLSAFTAEDTVAFFRELGVGLHVEENGKLFPDSNRAKTILDALLQESAARGVSVFRDHRVVGAEAVDGGFRVRAAPDWKFGAPQPAVHGATFRARRLVLATGGRSYPKTGSDGGGYELARGLGHSIVAITPALAPLILEGEFHTPLSGIAQDVEITVHVAGERPVRMTGAMLWTHFGVSGPAAMNVARVWERAQLDGQPVNMTVNFLPGLDFGAAEQKLIALGAAQPKAHVQTVIGQLIPARVAEALLRRFDIPTHVPMAHFSREGRRALVHALTAFPLAVGGTRGFDHAEVTAGGVPLSEIEPATMASRRCPGLFLVGEILDVDGRIGGFNFQWAWSSGFVAAGGLACELTSTPSQTQPN